MTSSLFTSVLQQVTEEKLGELKIQKDLLCRHFESFRDQRRPNPLTSHNVTAYLRQLHKALLKCPVDGAIDPRLIEEVGVILKNSADDPTLTQDFLETWIDVVNIAIDEALRKSNISFIYASLLSDWMAVEASPPVQETTPKTDYESAKDILLDSLFSPILTEDPDAFEEFMTSQVFNFESYPERERDFKRLQNNIKNFMKVEHYVVTDNDVRASINGLLAEDRITLEQKNALNEVSESVTAVEEVSLLLTTRLKNLSRWNWPEGQKLSVRRGMGGKYKAFLEEDLVTALFLQYLGSEWAAFFKREFFTSLDAVLSKTTAQLPCVYESIEWERNRFHRELFMEKLPDSVDSQGARHLEEYVKVGSTQFGFGASAEAAPEPAVPPNSGGTPFTFGVPPPPQSGTTFGASSTSSLFGANVPSQKSLFGFNAQAHTQTALLQHHRGTVPPVHVQPSASSFEQSAPLPAQNMLNQPMRFKVPASRRRQDIDFKQQLIHFLSTEIKLHLTLHPTTPLIVVQTEFDSLSTTLSHSAILTALKYFHVSDDWLKFFKTFLQPMVNLGSLGKDTNVTVRRGVLEGHLLSSAFSEMILFLLEFVVAERCHGLRLFRIDDEIWFAAEPDKAISGWEVIYAFSKTIGVSLNFQRSGSVTIQSPTTSGIQFGPAPLPQSDVHWGYLRLQSNGSFRIAEASLKTFVSEMSSSLTNSPTVLHWINAFNKWMYFFKRNHGKCANVFGTAHLSMVIPSIRLIYHEVFGSTSQSPATVLRSKFTILEDPDVLDSWIHWPLDSGGLGLVNPFIGLAHAQHAFEEVEEPYFSKLYVQDQQIYQDRLKAHAQEQPRFMATVEKMPSWEEFIQGRETSRDFTHWYLKFLELLMIPKVTVAKRGVISSNFSPGAFSEEDDPLGYIQILQTYYERQLVRHFGTVNFINSQLLPKTTIELIRKRKLQY